MFSLACHLMWFVEITIYRLSPMIGNEVTLNDQDQAACLRDRGFVQPSHAADGQKLRFAIATLCFWQHLMQVIMR